MTESAALPTKGTIQVDTPPAPIRATLKAASAGTKARRAARVAAVLTAEMSRQVGRGPRNVMAARGASRAFMRLGGVYMKLGQGVAAAPGVWGEDVAEEFRNCLDTGPVVPYAQVKAAIEAEIGCPAAEAFSWIDPDPIGRASLAVVHHAMTADGQEVAIKVLRPGIEALVGTDFALGSPPFAFAADRVGSAIAGAVDEVLRGLEEQLEEELDLRNEAASMDYHRRLFSRLGIDGVVVPECLPSLSGPRVLTMEYLAGRPLDCLDADEEVADEAAASRARIGEDLVGTWLLGVLSTGVFHADLHAGNLLALDDGRLGLIDWGIVGRLDDHTRRVMRVGMAAMLGDETRWAALGDELKAIYGDLLNESMGVSQDDLVPMIRSFFEPMFTQPFSAFSLAQLAQTMPQGVGGLGGAPGAKPRWGRQRVRDLRAGWNANRRARRLQAASGVRDSPFNRGTLMYVKQLVYLERHGHALLGDRPLLSDPDFYRRLLDATENGNVTWR